MIGSVATTARALGPTLKAPLKSAYLASCRTLAHLRLGREDARRDLSRLAVVGMLGRRNGIGSGAKLHFDALAREHPGTQLIDGTAALRNPLAHVPHETATAYIFHCAAPQTATLVQSVLPEAAKAYRIGYWAWELPDPPPGWREFGSLVSEIWVPSHFAAHSLGQLFDQPIHVVPHPIDPATPRQHRQGDPFTVLVMADSRSSLSRKNPVAAIAAFEQAFGADPKARLVVKLHGGGSEARRLLEKVEAMANATVITGFLDEAALVALYRESDVILSMHRAEGFGLPLLEAMAQGVPAIATGWSGNVDFMSPRDSVLVPYTLIDVVDDAGIYGGSQWADPSVDAAAEALVRLANDRHAYEALAARAHAAAHDARRRFSTETLS
ncbi:glycosyltransferase family 4 protein [Acuticoccus sp. M5D2P5]|uniref:glycosyltransferase family 4 protein n=1 Tax=Acuticoccus kalidii TaxID=2910977 RepID=UPI001F4842C7|nr:glycosyltransferase family 4 protein [Acuticoccus kalidii]MCF3935168.1 glycosyltransferase family 4 protein [Acuticoccus kalidii]